MNKCRGRICGRGDWEGGNKDIGDLDKAYVSEGEKQGGYVEGGNFKAEDMKKRNVV